jgi:hypothetical protein
LAALPDSQAAAPPLSPAGIAGGAGPPRLCADSRRRTSSRRNSEKRRSTTQSRPSEESSAMAYMVKIAPFSSTAVREASELSVSAGGGAAPADVAAAIAREAGLFCCSSFVLLSLRSISVRAVQLG